MRILAFFRDWMLPIAMILGVSLYYIYINIPVLESTRQFANTAVSIVQPTLIFLMLFLTFCRVELHDLRPCRWHVWLLLIQTLSFILLSLVAIFFCKNNDLRVLIEAAMLCMICPTATASAVVVRKLGGDVAHNTTYLILINLVTALVVPAFVPLVHPQQGIQFVTAFLLIVGKVFPLLLLPLVVAIIVRRLLPKLHGIIMSYPDLPFYMWSVALLLAMTMTAKTIHNTDIPLLSQVGIAVVSLISCIVQFYFGRRIGARYSDAITAGQTLGQKNTVLAIWMGYTFFTPITAIAGGFYSVWHNVANSYQLYKKRKEDADGV